jgi:hypothetical protein
MSVGQMFFLQKDTETKQRETKVKDQARIHPEKNPFKCAMFQSRGNV